ncbi:MAG: IS200/IS605 family transposase [Candidatus Methanoperedens sp.]|nr:MAG: IS200/IS605 family transposase [Candidatus Methanoperedens sp.]MBZ0175448.1 IS200/IS605 family transposase [Candidatus Methanoperedens nitroreducens]MCX9079712.1 IS200/IS605 family transposase [Candidatus Methanoperedens sp.]MCX9088176.1 IS200/IS605 family transposase [Candidatus Methanoperedens sp.]
MQYKLERGAHSVYTLQYHLVQVVKYRKKVFGNEKIVDLLKQKIHDISTTFHVEVLDIGCDIDHFHMIFRSKPTLEIPKYLNAVKTITSREIRRTFPEIKEKLCGDAFWSPSYFLATTGQVTLEQLNKYVENQGQGE